MMDYIDLLLEEQLERQEGREGDGTWNGDAVQVPLPQEKEIETVYPADQMDAEQTDRTGASRQKIKIEGQELADKRTTAGAAEKAARQELGEAVWTVRRWLTGQTEMSQAGARGAENGSQVHDASQSDLLPDMPWTGQRADGETVSDSGGADQFSGEWKELGRTAGPAAPANVSQTTGAGWLDRAVRVSLERLPAPDRESKVVTLEPAEWDGGAGRLELRQLDRLVRRDARRFDGGFQLL